MLIIKGFQSLRDRAVQIAREGRQAIGLRLYAALNALYESATGAPAPGSQRVDLRPHDHTPHGGGVSLARGALMSFDVGEDTTLSTAWNRDVLVPDMGSWLNLTPRTPYHVAAFVTPGLAAAVNAVGGSPCALEARLLLNVDLGLATSVDVRVRQVNLGTVSATATAVATGKVWVGLTDVPLEGGRVNGYVFEVRANGPGPLNRIGIEAAVFAETRTTSQPQSSGVNVYNAVPRP